MRPPGHRRHARALCLLLAVVAVVAGTGAQAAGAHATKPATRTGPGAITVTAHRWVNSRLEDFTMTTPAITHPVHVEVLVPVGYRAHHDTRYPAVYFLNGGSPGPTTGLEYLQWTRTGDAQQIIGNDKVIAVFPEGGSGGWYTNWYNGGKGGPPEWETFHIHELLPWIDAHYRTIDTRKGRAVIGLSMGGYGSMEYAARYPNLFGTAAAFSGAVDIADPLSVTAESNGIVSVMAKGAGGTAEGPFGTPTTDASVWEAHDPANLVSHLAHTHLFLYCGNGQPGPLDTAATVDAFSQGIEQLVDASNVEFDKLLAEHHIHATIDNYGPGTHSWPYWQRDLRESLPMIVRDLTSAGR